MKCPNCGNKAGRKDIFCEVCGTYLKDQDRDDWNDELDLDLDTEEKEEAIEMDEEIIEDKEDSEDFVDLKEKKVEKKEEKEDKKDKKESKKKEKVFSVKDSSGTGKKFSYENEDLLEAYIGEDYKLIKKSFFNIWAFLFNWLYVLYRKLYVTGIIGLVISWVVIAFFKNWKYILIYLLIVSILLALLFSPYYIFISKRKVEKLKSQNEGEDSFTLSGICKEKGGVKVLPALLFYSVFLILVFFTITSLRFTLTFRTKYWEENRDNLANCTSLVKVVYRNISENHEVGDVNEAVCKIITADTKEYEVYVKTKKEKEIIYSYYKTQNGYIARRGDTVLLNELIERQKKVILTEDEKQKLMELQSMEINYQKYHDQAEKEDLLIKQRKDKKEKLSYVLNKEEIIR